MNPDAQLINDCRKGNRKAQYLLFRSCFPVLMGVCSRYSQDEEQAQSGMNESFLKILDNLDKWKSNTPFEPWIRRIAINVMIDAFRKNRRVKELIEYRDFSGVQEENSLTDPDWQVAPNPIDAEVLQRMIQQLPPTSQKVFNLFAIDGFKHQEIARLLKMSEGTSKWHLSSARKKLKEWVKEYLHQHSTINKIH